MRRSYIGESIRRLFGGRSYREEGMRIFFQEIIPRERARGELARIEMRIIKARFLEEVYKTPTSELETLRQKTECEWKAASWYDRMSARILSFNTPKIVRKEILYRSQGNEKASDELRQPLADVLERCKKEGLGDLVTSLIPELSQE